MLSSYVRRTLCNINSLASRQLNTSGIVYSVEKSPLFKLRQKTGLAYSLCREALDKHDNDLDEAEAWLKAQALARGLQKATRVRGRSTREGLVGLANHEDNKIVTVIELNCETDFVARNQVFKDFTIDLTEQVASLFKESSPKPAASTSVIEELVPSKSQLQDIDNQLIPLISKLGENIKLERAVHFRVAESDELVFGRIHAMVGQKSSNTLEMMAGRFGAIVALKKLTDANYPLKDLGNRICQHVIGYNPTYIELPESIRQHLEAAEKANSEQVSEETCEEEEYSDSEEAVVSHNCRDDWPSIMDQMIIGSEDLCVRDFCKKNDISIIYFNRFECGEGT